MCPWSLDGGVDGAGWSFDGFGEEDLLSFEEPLPWESLGSSTLPICVSISFDFSRSRPTASDDFFLTNPAASSAVVARCMMLTLPDLAFRPLDPDSLSLSFKLPTGVEGCERNEIISPVKIEEDGDNIGDLVEDLGRGGVTGLTDVGVGGTKANCGAVIGTA